MHRMAYLWIAAIPMFVLYIMCVYKRLRNDRNLFILLLPSFVFAILGIVVKVPEAGMFAGPFVYLSTYACLRWAYKRIYRMEPTYNRSSWYDEEDGRKQNWMDVITFILPLCLSFILPLAIVIGKSKGAI